MSEIEELEAFFSSISAAPRFTDRAVNIPGEFRTGWRLSVLCLILSRGRANQLALDHLHVLWWAVRSSTSRALFLRWATGEKSPDEIIVRFDPSLTATVDLATGQQLVGRTRSGLIKLTSAGLSLTEIVASETKVLVREKEFLQKLPSKISQRQLSDLLEWA